MMLFGDDLLVERAKMTYALRRQRDQALGEHAGLVGEPAWDMLLDLFVSLHEHRKVGACSASIGACAATTTGLRCIGGLSRAGLVQRRNDPVDGRRSLVDLTPEGVDTMRSVLASLTLLPGVPASASLAG